MGLEDGSESSSQKYGGYTNEDIVGTLIKSKPLLEMGGALEIAFGNIDGLETGDLCGEESSSLSGEDTGDTVEYATGLG